MPIQNIYPPFMPTSWGKNTPLDYFAAKKRAFHFRMACVRDRRCQKSFLLRNDKKNRDENKRHTFLWCTNTSEWHFRVYGNILSLLLLAQSFLVSKYNSMCKSFVKLIPFDKGMRHFFGMGELRRRHSSLLSIAMCRYIIKLTVKDFPLNESTERFFQGEGVFLKKSYC